MRLPPPPTPWRVIPGTLAGILGTALTYTALTRADWVALPFGLLLLGLGIYLVGLPIAQSMLLLSAMRRRSRR